MNPVHTLALPTLDQPPSWLNQNGRPDRSACCEVTVGEVRRLAGSVQFKPQIWPEMKKIRLPTQPLPNERPARNRHGRVATGRFRLTADHVLTLLGTRQPRDLAGDWRTSRASVMRPKWFDPDKPHRFRAGCKNAEEIFPIDAGLDANPNKGATRSKIIGIWETWYQPVRLEKWQFPTRRLPAYFLTCPGHALGDQQLALERRLNHRSRAKRTRIEQHLKRVRDWMHGNLREEEFGDPPPMRDDPRLPPLSKRPPGREDPTTGKCPQRAYKLLLPLCTEQEFLDACLAQQWIESLPSSVPPKVRGMVDRLYARYGLLFQPRVMLCQRCLGVRYGNDPENARQSWRRLAGKPDARPAKRKVVKSNNAAWARKQRRKRATDAND